MMVDISICIFRPINQARGFFCFKAKKRRGSSKPDIELGKSNLRSTHIYVPPDFPSSSQFSLFQVLPNLRGV